MLIHLTQKPTLQRKVADTESITAMANLGTSNPKAGNALFPALWHDSCIFPTLHSHDMSWGDFIPCSSLLQKIFIFSFQRMFFFSGLPKAISEVPKALTLLGASLMFFAVITMALTRLPRRARVADPPQQVPPAEAEATVDTPKSLASFAASEYAEREVRWDVFFVFGSGERGL